MERAIFVFDLDRRRQGSVMSPQATLAETLDRISHEGDSVVLYLSQRRFSNSKSAVHLCRAD